MKEMKVELDLILGNDKEIHVIFEHVTDLYVDYEHNTLALYDADKGNEYRYHFTPKGDETEHIAKEIKSFTVTVL